MEMGLADDTVDAISEKFDSATNPDGTGTSEREVTCVMGSRAITWGQRKKIS